MLFGGIKGKIVLTVTSISHLETSHNGRVFPFTVTKI